MAGGLIMLQSRKAPRAVTAPLGLIGLGIFARALTNMELMQPVGVEGERAAIELQKTILINTPPEEVFRLWTSYKNFPRFMSHVQEVRETGYDQSHWKITGPAGVPVEWNAVITRLVENEVVSWKTLPGAMVQHTGSVRFFPEAPSRTRVQIRLSYNPGAGAVGHAAALLGADPKRQLDDDLMRMKSFLESSRRPADATASPAKYIGDSDSFQT